MPIYMKGVNEMNIAGILAGGIGSRMGSTLPKQFLEIGGIPIIVRVINRFINNENIDYAIIAMNSEWMDYCKEMLIKWGIDTEKIALIEGGETRFESLYNIAKKAYEYNNESVVISHDCARVFVSDAIINNNIEMIKEMDCTTTSVPTIDTVIVSTDGITSDSVPNRDTIFLDQGPQTFKAKEFIDMADALSADERAKYMEAGRMYLDKGLKVGIVEGERTNFKMTTDFDIKYGEFLLSEGYIK